jgi:hypothetical protein
MLIEEGDAAVEPLLAAIESDTRLTRTVTYGRGMSIDRRVHPVLEPEFAALTGLLKTDQFRGREYDIEYGRVSRKELAGLMRDYWTRNRALPLAERWYRTLRDDAAGYARWSEAAASIVQPSNQVGPAAVWAVARARRPGAAPMKGEELRSRRDPSVSDLLARRVLQIARAPRQRTIPDVELERACQLALVLDRWDRKAALPVIRALMTQAREVVDRDRAEGYNQYQGLVSYVAQFAVLRARGGEPAALAEYAAEIRKSNPERDQPNSLATFEPMWTFPYDPAIREAARWLFNDPGSPWTAFVRAPGNPKMQFLFHSSLYASPLLRAAGFRGAAIAAMASRSRLGTIRRSGPGMLQYELGESTRGGFTVPEADLEGIEQGVDRPYRVCDYIAWQVSTIEGSPRCELYWSEEMRDQAVEACVGFLKTLGDRFTAEAPHGSDDPRYQAKAHLAFPILDHPATKDDVRAARAIFSLEGEGEVRRLKVPGLPLKARWVGSEDAPREKDQEGWVWQAEQVRKGDRRESYCGFVGPHVIARVPAAEIQLAAAGPADRWGQLSRGLDAQIAPAGPGRDVLTPGRPVPLIVRIRNRRGVDDEVPTDFLRRGPGGRLSLRRGVSLAVFYSAPGQPGPRPPEGGPAEELMPKQADRFDPGPATRPLGPFEALDAMPIELTEWFDLTRTGSYRVHLSLTVDSGLGEGTSNELYLTVGDEYTKSGGVGENRHVHAID